MPFPYCPAALLYIMIFRTNLVGSWFHNDVVATSMRGNYVAPTSIRRHFTSCARWEEISPSSYWRGDGQTDSVPGVCIVDSFR